MAKLTLFLNGTKISETELDPEKTYILGRSGTADILLDSKDMSRQHAKLKFEADQWTCEITSRYGRMLVAGNQVEKIIFEKSLSFQILPFDLKFEFPEMLVQQEVEVSEERPSPEEKGDDHTQTGQLNLRAVLYRLDAKGSAIEEFILGEGLIEAGRSRSCQVRLNDEKSSRKHFKLENNGHLITLTDLGSPNLTYVNGKAVKKQKLESGDEIQVGDEKLRFELIDPNFDNLPIIHSEKVVEFAPGGEMPAVIKYRPSTSTPAKRISKKYVADRGKSLRLPFMAIAGLTLGFVLYLGLSGNSEKSETERHVAGQADGKTGAGNLPADKYTAEQRKFLDDTYNLVMNLYTSGKYDLAALEIDKILRIDPNYKDSKNIQALAQQALEIKKQKDESDRRQAEQDAISRKVNDILDECDKILSLGHFHEVEACVLRISDMDPENARGQNLVLAAKQELERIDEKKQHKVVAIRRKNDALATFNKAQKDFNEKRFPAAINSFEKVEAMPFDDSTGLKQRAKAGVQAAKSKIVESSDAAYKEGKTALDAKDYKKAISKLSEALKIYSQNGDAKLSKEKAESELHIIMKNIYSESVIDENIGNIEPAKKKWRQIIDDDVPTDDYYMKAKMKIGKYEK